MKKNILIILYIILFSLTFVSATDFSASSGSYQYTAPNFNSYYSSSEMGTYWPILKQMEEGNCSEGTDFMVSIPISGCSPAVVRSDLLADQNVPIFCQLSAVRINPLIQVSSISSISFQGDKPKGVLDISFHPARAAIKSYNTLSGSPIMDNIGYVVIVLDQTKNESSLPDWISGNLTATMNYDIDKAYGTGKAEYYLPVISEESWSNNFQEYGFWNGKGFIRTEEIEGDKAKISLYLDADQKYHTINLEVGEESNVLYFPFSYCKAGLQVKLEKIATEEDQALLNIDGDQIWVRKDSKIFNNRCSITDLRILPDKTGTVDISCPQKKLSLSILPRGAKFNENSYSIGDKIVDETYLVYSGKLPAMISDKEEVDFAVVYDKNSEGLSELSASISEFIYNLVNNNLNTRYTFKNFQDDLTNKFGVSVLLKDEPIGNDQLRFNGLSDIALTRLFSESESPAGEVIDDYIENSEKVLNNLVENYPTEKEKYDLDSTSLAEEALYDSIKTAKETGNSGLALNLCNLFLEKYVNSQYRYEVLVIFNNINSFDLSLSQSRIFVNNADHYVSLDELRPLDKTNKKARLLVSGGRNEEVYEGQNVYLLLGENNQEKSDYIEVEQINIGEAVIVYHHKVEKDEKKSEEVLRKTLKENEPQEFYGRVITIQNIDVQKVAYVSINPHIDNAKSTADFTFKIGIEKRDIQLSDEKTQEMIKNLNKSIAKWEEINTKLGSLIKAWKGACFATSIVLMAKSTISGFTGQGIARQTVMEAYRDECDSNSNYNGMSHTECYNLLSSSIDKDVEALTNSISETNKQITQWNSVCKISDGSLFSGTVIDEDCVKKKMRDAIKSKIGEDNVQVQIGDRNYNVPIDKIEDYDTLRALLAEKGVTTGVVDNAISQDVNAELKLVALIAQEEEARNTAGKEIGSVYTDSSKDLKIEDLDDSSAKVSKLWGQDTFASLSNSMKTQIRNGYPGIKEDTPIQFVQLNGIPYLLILKTSATQTSEGVSYSPVVAFEKDRESWNKLESLSITSNSGNPPKSISLSNYIFYSGGSCSNTYSNAQVKYYDSGDFKGMPSIVPVSLKEGWYAKVSQTPGGIFSTEQQGYKQSGQVSFFYLCNVGRDGLEKNAKWPDDICMSIDVNNYKKYDSFAGCPSVKGSAFQKLIEDSQEAIRQASSQYGEKQVRILGQTINTGLSVEGENLAECQDFMSPNDCKILFNVCDPVICPASRCNLGGSYPVSDVIQSGIVGSIFLCLPNIKEGVMIPVCLSGIYAGIESFVSILESERDCLQTSLDTGEHVGICDEITSIYMCEFFWRQLAPITKLLIPKLIEMAYGQGTRGGGEYLSTKNSWDTLQKNIDYFKNTYAQNAFRAFEVRSVEEVGSDVCKSFIGTSLPSSASLLDNLLDPESPEQVSAWFSEIKYSEATVPATSHYKVYFHIFAGNDQSVQFRVYLKNPPDSSYYQSNQILNVKTGYLAKGETADESIDFTAPEGYKELCVVLNAEEHCGFKSVSTSFATEYLASKYIEQQASEGNITTEKECISGTPSILSTTSANIQTRAESVVSSSANLQGIVRVCSTANPGKAVDTQTTESTLSALGDYTKTTDSVSVNFNQRWQLVGYCDNPNIGCWLDTESVKDEVKKVQSIEDSLSEVELLIAGLDSATNKETEESVISQLSEIKTKLENENWEKDFKKSLNGLNNKDKITEGVTVFISEDEGKLKNLGGDNPGDVPTASLNTDIAKAKSLRVKLYNLVVKGLYNKYIFKTPVVEEISKNIKVETLKPEPEANVVSSINSIKFYDSPGEEIKNKVCFQDGTLIDIFLEVKADSECVNLKCDLMYYNLEDESSVIRSDLDCNNNQLPLRNIIYNYFSSIKEGKFSIWAKCLNDKSVVINSVESEKIGYSSDEC